jgi:hypothetical protein
MVWCWGVWEASSRPHTRRLGPRQAHAPSPQPATQPHARPPSPAPHLQVRDLLLASEQLQLLVGHLLQRRLHLSLQRGSLLLGGGQPLAARVQVGLQEGGSGAGRRQR